MRIYIFDITRRCFKIIFTWLSIKQEELTTLFVCLSVTLIIGRFPMAVNTFCLNRDSRKPVDRKPILMGCTAEEGNIFPDQFFPAKKRPNQMTWFDFTLEKCSSSVEHIKNLITLGTS